MFNDYLRFLVRETEIYIGKVRGENIEFKLEEEDGFYKAKFDYGRIAEDPDINTAICMAIANALIAIDHDT